MKHYAKKYYFNKRLKENYVVIIYQVRALRADDGIELVDAEFGRDEFCDFGR